MSVHNTEVHRCRECNEVVIVVPDGFKLTDEELTVKAEEHRQECSVLLGKDAVR